MREATYEELAATVDEQVEKIWKLEEVNERQANLIMQYRERIAELEVELVRTKDDYSLACNNLSRTIADKAELQAEIDQLTALKELTEVWPTKQENKP